MMNQTQTLKESHAMQNIPPTAGKERWHCAAKTLKSIRTALHYSQEQVAQATGLQKSKISAMESMNVPISFLMLDTLCDFYGVASDYVRGRTDDPVATKQVTMYTQMIQRVLNDNVQRVSCAVAVALVDAQSGMMAVAEFKHNCQNVLDAFDRFVSANPEFEDMRCGSPIASKIELLRQLVRKQNKQDERNKLISDPNDLMRFVTASQVAQSAQSNMLGDVDAAQVERAFRHAAKLCNPSGSLFEWEEVNG